MEWFIYIGIGVLAGFLAGLFGIGGGLIIIPLLSYAFLLQRFNFTLNMHMAVATSLAIIFFTSLSSVFAQVRYSAVNWSVFVWMAGGMIFGSFCGAIFASHLADSTMKIAIGVFALLMALQLLWSSHYSIFKTHSSGNTSSHPLTFILGGTVIGALSSIFGIGGGVLTVPYLNWCRIPMKIAIGTSSACALPISLASSFGYLVMSWGQPDLPPWSLGYIYLPALFTIAFCSLFFAQFGVRLSHRLSSITLKRIFALLLVFIGLNFIFR